MIFDLSAMARPVASTAIGVGIWTTFAWIWFSCPRERRFEMCALAGIAVTAAFGAGIVAGILVGEFALSSLGALFGGALAMIFASPPLRAVERWKWDHLVPAGLAGLAVARVGCLLEGCDFGRLADGGLRVVYGEGTRAWSMHIVEHGLSPSSAISYPVHPFGGYLALWGLAAAIIGALWRRRNPIAGMAASLSALVFFAGGGMIELLREPTTVPHLVEGVSLYPFLYWGAAIVAAGACWRLIDSESPGAS